MVLLTPHGLEKLILEFQYAGEQEQSFFELETA